eukprot:2593419-Amphidinium_carterae.1
MEWQQAQQAICNGMPSKPSKQYAMEWQASPASNMQWNAKPGKCNMQWNGKASKCNMQLTEWVAWAEIDM